MSEVINNNVLTINFKELEFIKRKLSFNDNVYVVELDGEHIQSWKDYIIDVQSKFQFPTSCINSIDRYLDWIRDLDWLNKEEYVLIINNFNSFIKDDSKLKNQIISRYIDTILPFWQDEVKEVVVEGRPKSFMVYLVD